MRWFDFLPEADPTREWLGGLGGEAGRPYMKPRTYRGPRQGDPQLSLSVHWDVQYKKWRLWATIKTETGGFQTIRATADSAAAIDRATATALLKLVCTDLESRLY